jgi:hypothetical protein
VTFPRSGRLIVVALGLLVAACGGPAERASLDPSASTPASAAASTGTASGSPSVEPTVAPSAVQPTEAPTDTAEPSASGDPGSGSAAACSGSDENREFFAAVAGSVDWPVYCPALPDGWFVASGEYRLAGGGWLEIAFRGPGDARIDLREGAICSGDDCVPTGADLGEAAFGGLTGSLLDIGDGRLAVVVGPDASLAWTLVGSGLAEGDVRTIAADLALVEG